MFEELDKYLHVFTPHEQERYQLLCEMSEEEQAAAYEQDSRFQWKGTERIGRGEDDVTRGFTQKEIPKQELLIRRNKRFIHCMKHRHDYIEMQYVYSGTLCNIIEEKKICVGTGEFLLMDASVDHEILPSGKEDIGINIIMHKEYFDSQFRDMLARNDYVARMIVDSLYARKEEKKYILFRVGKEDRIQTVMRLLLDEWRVKESGYDMALQGYMLTVFANLMRNYGEKTKASGVDMKRLFIEKLKAYLAKNYKEADLKSTAEYFNFNQDYLSRLIKKQIGVSFIGLLQEIRMEQARIMLSNTELSVEEVAENLGYGDVSYFYKVFRKTYGITPGEYRKINKK